MPDPVQAVSLLLGQAPYTKPPEQLFEGGAVEGVEVGPTDLLSAYPVHRGRVPAPPGVGESRPVGVETLLLAEFLALPDDAGALVYDRAEHVEDEGHRVVVHPTLTPMRLASEAISSWGMERTPLLQLAHAPCCSS